MCRDEQLRRLDLLRESVHQYFEPFDCSFEIVSCKKLLDRCHFSFEVLFAFEGFLC